MRFAITAVDRYLGVFESLVKAGWEPVKLFTVPVTGFFDSHNGVVDYAQKRRIAIQLSRMTTEDLSDLARAKCDVLVVASYNWKIDDWRPYLPYAINIHASPLPEGKGAYPLVEAIIRQKTQWGVACQKLDQKMDSGDILRSETFALDAEECHERLDLKVQMAAKKLASDVAADFKNLWQHAVPQTQAAYYPRFSTKDRLIDFALPVEIVMRKIRAYGLLECFASANNTFLSVKRAVGWAEAHQHSIGHVVHVCNRTIVIAAQDGYIGLVEWNFAPIELADDLSKAALANISPYKSA